MKANLYIYSTNYYSNKFLEYNHYILKRANPKLRFKWFVCDQTPIPIEPGYDILRHKEFVIVNRDNDEQGSISHGNGLNFILKYARENHHKVDYHLVLDPDCILFYPIDKLIFNKRRQE